MKTKTKRKPKKTVKKMEPPEPKPQVPQEILNDFLEEKVNLSNLEDISMIRAGYLWTAGGIQRYRLNVWSTTYESGAFSSSTKIIHSFFIHYDPEENKIVDRTKESEPKKQKFF